MSKTNESVQKRVDIGGQAVMEGVMMKAPRAIAVSVRPPDHTIVTQLSPTLPCLKSINGWAILSCAALSICAPCLPWA